MAKRAKGSTPVQWTPVYDAAGMMQVGQWQAAGYAIAELRSPVVTFAVTRPGDDAPAFYSPSRFEVSALIEVDLCVLAQGGCDGEQ